MVLEMKNGCDMALAGRVFAMLEIVKNRRQDIGIPAYLKPFVLRHLDEFIKNAKQGLFLNHKDEYVVDLDRTGRYTDLHPVITIEDKATGTDLTTSQWSEGLHQFIQLKHGCRLSPYSLKAVFISNVSYLKGYKRLNGFSGTLGSVEENKILGELYDADMLKLPTWKPKMFNENAPILAATKENWVKSIFEEVCDQILANRSVLVICQSIKKVEELEKDLKQLYSRMISPSPKVAQAVNCIIMYRREFDDNAFMENLSCCQIIISTNLSGRGTDINLNEDLVKSGGLHVIVTFLPDNSRIEEQAYGRAARCGQKGSGQIICMVEEENGASNIFQLKQFRDNAEIHRLRSLKQHYDYHIAVEETCLKLFEDHCGHVMKAVHSPSKKLSIVQVIYFALLDEWAGWLDSKAEKIRECKDMKNDLLKEHIIASAKEFLEKHPLPEVSDPNDYDHSLAWIERPQPLLSIALIYLESDQIGQAVEMLDKIIREFPEFQAEAYYYKGIIEQWNIHQALVKSGENDENGKSDQVIVEWLLTPVNKVLKTASVIKLKSANWMVRNIAFTDDCPDDFIQRCTESVQKATEYFLLSRSLFSTRIHKRNGMARIVADLQLNSSSFATRGYAAQQEETIAVLACFIGNIDDLLGHRATPEDVKLGDEPPHLTVRRFREFVKRADLITPPQLTAKMPTNQQLSVISTNHCLPIHALKVGFQKMCKNEELEEYDGQKIVRAGELAAVFFLPSVRGFWESLRRAGCFFSEQAFIAVRKENKKDVPVLGELTPVSFELKALQMQLSTEDLAEYNLYDVTGTAKEFKSNGAKNAELQEAEEAGFVHIEVIATINPLALITCQYLDQFSLLRTATVASELGISIAEAEWIMQRLRQHGVVEKSLAEITNPEEMSIGHKATEEQTNGGVLLRSK